MSWDPQASLSCPPLVIERFKKKYPQYVLEDGSIQIVGQAHRSQKANMDDCVERLQAMINSVATPPKPRKPTKPKRSAVLKRLQTKKRDSEKKQNRSKSYE